MYVEIGIRGEEPVPGSERKGPLGDLVADPAFYDRTLIFDEIHEVHTGPYGAVGLGSTDEGEEIQRFNIKWMGEHHDVYSFKVIPGRPDIPREEGDR